MKTITILIVIIYIFSACNNEPIIIENKTNTTKIEEPTDTTELIESKSYFKNTKWIRNLNKKYWNGDYHMPTYKLIVINEKSMYSKEGYFVIENNTIFVGTGTDGFRQDKTK